jgi:uncharacterized protein (TIGR02147 family)
MKHLVDYFNFRCYLADYYDQQKAGNRNFSYRYFSNRIGFKSKDFIYRVIHKDKVISDSSIAKISQAIGHSEKETEYFECMVRFNQAKTAAEKNRFFKRLLQLKEKHLPKSKAVLLKKHEQGFFSSWYNPIIFSIIGIVEFKGDFSWLANRVTPAISTREARQAVKQLEELGFIKKNHENIYATSHSSVKTEPELQNLGLLNFYLHCADLARDAIEKMPRDERNITGVTLGISARTYTAIIERTNLFREEITRLAEMDEEPEQVYQMNMQLFPVSTPLKKRGNNG